MHEGTAKIGDYVTAQLVECAEPDAVDVSTDLPPAPEGSTQAQQIAQATIEQTGADPPPMGLSLMNIFRPALLHLLYISYAVIRG